MRFVNWIREKVWGKTKAESNGIFLKYHLVDQEILKYRRIAILVKDRQYEASTSGVFYYKTSWDSYIPLFLLE